MTISISKIKVISLNEKYQVRSKIIIINVAPSEHLANFQYLFYDLTYRTGHDINNNNAKFNTICGN